MNAGMLINDTQPTTVQQVFALTKLVLLHEDVDRDANTLHGALPQQAEITQVDVILDATAGAPTQAKIILFWDSLGDNIAFGPSAYFDLAAGLTDTSLRMGTLSVNTQPRVPAGQTTKGKLYGTVLVDTGTVTVTTLRVHWTDDRDGA